MGRKVECFLLLSGLTVGEALGKFWSFALCSIHTSLYSTQTHRNHLGQIKIDQFVNKTHTHTNI